MNQQVRLAINAAKHGKDNEALELCKQALAANPNDVDAWLVVAAVVDQPERKRQCLNRVLSIDPTNQSARAKLLDLDRADMGGAPASARKRTPIPQPTHPPRDPLSNNPTSSSAFESASAPKPSTPVASQARTKTAYQPSAKAHAEEPLIFGISLAQRILIYSVVVFFGFVGVLVIVVESKLAGGLALVAMALLAGILAEVLAPKVEITEANICVSIGLVSSSEIRWDEIKSMRHRYGVRRLGLDLIKSDGQSVRVPDHVNGYGRIVEIIRQKRPDLFHMADSSAPSSGYEGSVPAPVFLDTKTFRKSFIRQHAITLVVLFLCLYFVWLGFQDPENLPFALAIAVFCAPLMLWNLLRVSVVKVEPNRLTMETLLEQKELSARQIKDIKLETVSGRRGKVRVWVVVIPVKGRKYSLNNFPESEEVVYGFLMNWWEHYRDR